MVVVDREHEAQPLQPRLALRAQHDPPVRHLPRERALDPGVDDERGAEQAVAKGARGIAGETCREREGVRAARP